MKEGVRIQLSCDDSDRKCGLGDLSAFASLDLLAAGGWVLHGHARREVWATQVWGEREPEACSTEARATSLNSTGTWPRGPDILRS
eukprot:365955-Chlamydomonas_euryale.AAC.2